MSVSAAPSSAMFKRLCYLIAEGFDICSIQGIDADTDQNARIVYRVKNPQGRWRLHSEEFRVESRESRACAELFLDFLHSEGAS